MPWPAEDPETYFANRDLSLLVVKDPEHGDYTADILTADRSRCIAARYASGATADEAGVSAVHRWHVEQDPPPPLPRRLP